MPVTVITAPDVVDIGDTWRSWLMVMGTDGALATPDDLDVAVTEPDGTEVAATVTAQTTTGLYLVTYDVVQPGDHLAVVTVASATFGNDVEGLAFVAVDPESHEPPDASDTEDVLAYLGASTSATVAEVADAMEAEIWAQRRVCRVPVPYPPDLAQALKRRVARNLAARMVPVASFTAFEGGSTSARVPQTDAEIRRFEAPFRKLPVA